MTITRCTDCTFDNTRMTNAGYEILAIEDRHYADGITEREVLWTRDEHPIEESELPY